MSPSICGYCERPLVRTERRGKAEFACPDFARTGELCRQGREYWARKSWMLPRPRSRS